MMEKVAIGLVLNEEVNYLDSKEEEPAILEEIDIEDLFVDGICGVY